MPDRKPGDDGYTTVGCKSAVVPALLLTIFYALPRLAFDSFRARREGRPTGGAGTSPGTGTGGSTRPGGAGTSGGTRPPGRKR